MFRDFKELLSALNAHKVKYLVVGGQAVIVHAQPRATKDLDILIQPAPKNGEAVFRALVEFGAPLGKLTAADFVEKGSFFTMGVPPVAIDILPEIAGITFERAWKSRTIEVVDPDTGLTALFISRDDLITAKLAAGRPQDLADVDAIRKASAIADKTPKPLSSKGQKKKQTKRRSPKP